MGDVVRMADWLLALFFAVGTMVFFCLSGRLIYVDPGRAQSATVWKKGPLGVHAIKAQFIYALVELPSARAAPVLLPPPTDAPSPIAWPTKYKRDGILPFSAAGRPPMIFCYGPIYRPPGR